jgi:hypothetical protein
MRHILELTLCQPPLNLTQEATGGANNIVMRHILEFILRQPPLNLTQEALIMQSCGTFWD